MGSQYRGRGRGGTSLTSSKPKKSCANPIFESWLMEWREDAVEKSSKMQFVYSKALSSLRRYPLPLTNGKDCILLEFFGNALCNKIDERISKDRELHGASQGSSGTGSSQGTQLADLLLIPDSLSPAKNAKPKANTTRKRAKAASTAGDDSDGSQGISSPAKRSKGTGRGKNYIPAFRSGGYAILATLLKKEEDPGYRGYMLKSELLREAQDHCDASFTKPELPGSKYTAWSSMATLVQKAYVLKQGNPVKFMLSVEGRELAAKLLNADAATAPIAGPSRALFSQTDDSSEEGSQATSEAARQSAPRIQFLPGQFEIILLVDNGETIAKSKKEEVIGELRKNGVPLEVVKLNIGDFVWICRKNQCQQGNRGRLTISRSTDVVLPFVVERKRADDLAHSIKDGRFHEQKHRLSQTGLKPLYLVEAYGSWGDWGLAEGALNQALANTQITDGFLVHETSSLKDTCGFLTHMTRHLSKIYLDKTISSCIREEWSSLKDSTTTTYLMAFNDFNEFATKTKNWTVSEMFARHILKLRGISVERAHAIIERYPTLHALMRAYDSCRDTKEKELLLSTIHFGTAGRTIGPAISKNMCKLYTSRQLE